MRKSKDQKTTLDPPGQIFLILYLLRVAEERAALRAPPGALVRKSKDQKTTLDPPGQTFLILSLLRVAEERAALGAGGGM